MRYKKNIIIIVMCISIFIMGIGYALISTQMNIYGSSAITSNWKIEFSDIRTKELHGGATNVVKPTIEGTRASFEVDLVLPGDYVLYEIDITNYGDIDAEVKGATYSVSGSDAIFVVVDGIKKGTDLPSCEGLDTCPTITLFLRVGYDGEMTTTPTEKSKSIEFNIEVGQVVKDNPIPESDLIPELAASTLVDKIFLNNKAYADNVKSEFVDSDTGIDFSNPSSTTNGQGLYYTSVRTEGNKTTYYFRGNVNNNYVKFGKDTSGNDIFWRIIRINEDGSVRLVTQNVIGDSKYNELYNDNAYVGYMYGLPESITIYGDINEDGSIDVRDSTLLAKYIVGDELFNKKQLLLADINHDGSVTNEDLDVLSNVIATQKYNIEDYSDTERYNKTHANVTDSTIKTYIDNWYQKNLNSYAYLISKEAGFCNDRSVASSAGLWNANDTALGYGTNVTYYGLRKNNETIQFACPQSNDLFTVSTSTKGNKTLTYLIGMLTALDVTYSGIVGSVNESAFLTNGNNYWLMSPFLFDGQVAVAAVRSNGQAGGSYIEDIERGVRPVINLNSSVQLSSELPEGCTEQNGTEACPYIIKTN